MELFHAFPLFAHDFPIKSSIEKGGPASQGSARSRTVKCHGWKKKSWKNWRPGKSWVGHVIGKPWPMVVSTWQAHDFFEKICL
jgi:hypothetical protein